MISNDLTPSKSPLSIRSQSRSSLLVDGALALEWITTTQPPVLD